jgi:tRNA(Leu) C34 or U34 (ribose-2'-O)-methylase TrmL
MKRSHSQITPSEISVQFNVRGASIRKTGQLGTLKLSNDNEISTDSVYLVLTSKISSELLEKYHVIFYNNSLHGWEDLTLDAHLSTDVLKRSKEDPGALPILDVLLDDPRQLPDENCTTSSAVATTSVTNSFAVGMWHSKTAYNLVSLRRSATQLGADFVFSIADRMKNKKPLDETFRDHVLLVKEYKTVLDFSLDTICGEYEWVCVEMGGIPLEDFVHPAKALYILGSEDNGISSMLRSACKHVVALSSVRSESYNVAVAGTMIMYDRHVKSLVGAQKRK